MRKVTTVNYEIRSDFKLTMPSFLNPEGKHDGTDKIAGYPDMLTTTRDRLKKRQLLLQSASTIQETNSVAVNYDVELGHPMNRIVFFQVKTTPKITNVKEEPREEFTRPMCGRTSEMKSRG